MLKNRFYCQVFAMMLFHFKSNTIFVSKEGQKELFNFFSKKFNKSLANKKTRFIFVA